MLHSCAPGRAEPISGFVLINRPPSWFPSIQIVGADFCLRRVNASKRRSSLLLSCQWKPRAGSRNREQDAGFTFLSPKFSEQPVLHFVLIAVFFRVLPIQSWLFHRRLSALERISLVNAARSCDLLEGLFLVPHSNNGYFSYY